MSLWVDNGNEADARNEDETRQRQFGWSLDFVLRQRQQEGVDGLAGGLVGGVDGEVGKAAVEGMSLAEAELGGDGVCEDGAGYVLEDAAVEEGGEGCVEEDGEGGGGLLEQEAVGEFFGGSPAEGEDGVVVAEG